MRNPIPWLTLALTAVLALGGRGAAQPPPGPGGTPGPFGRLGPLERIVDDLNLSGAKRDAALAALQAYQDNVRRFTAVANSALLLKMKETLTDDEFHSLGEALDSSRAPGVRRLTVDDVIARIMSFDKNNDGKVTRDELPERMQHLIDQGDTNKDGALDKDEIRKLAADLARDEAPRGAGPGAGPRLPGGRSDAGDGLTARAVERAVNNLKLADKAKETAAEAVKAHRENVRALTELARADLLLAIGDVLSAEESARVEAALDRLPDPSLAPPFRPGRGGPPPGFRGPNRPPEPDRPN